MPSVLEDQPGDADSVTNASNNELQPTVAFGITAGSASLNSSGTGTANGQWSFGWAGGDRDVDHATLMGQNGWDVGFSTDDYYMDGEGGAYTGYITEHSDLPRNKVNANMACEGLLNDAFGAFQTTADFTSMFITSQDMQAAGGSFDLSGSTGDQDIVVGFEPSIVFFMATDQNGEGPFPQDNSWGSYGAAVSDTEQFCIAGFGDYLGTGGFGSDARANRYASDLCILAIDPSGDIRAASFVGMNSDGFRINVQTAGSWYVTYLAIRGGEDDEFFVGTFTQKGSSGTQGYTGVGFEPDTLMGFHNHTTSETADTAQHKAGFGLADSNLNQRAIVGGARGSGSVGSRAWVDDFLVFRATGGDDQATLTSYDADGFTLDFDNGGSNLFGIVAMRLPLVKFCVPPIIRYNRI